VGSCCSIAAFFTATLQLPVSSLVTPMSPRPSKQGARPPLLAPVEEEEAEDEGVQYSKQAERMMQLAQRLTPQFPRQSRRHTANAPHKQHMPHTPGSQRTAARQGGEGSVGETEKIRIVLVTTATGSYNRFVDPLIESGRRYFLAGEAYEVFYVVFTDVAGGESWVDGRVSYVYRNDLGWPLTAMLRYRSFLDSWHLLAHAHYIFRSCLSVSPCFCSHLYLCLVKGVLHLSVRVTLAQGLAAVCSARCGTRRHVA